MINGVGLPVNLELVNGIQRDHKGIEPTIDTRLSSGRKALYALMGSGYHGKTGLSLPTTLHIYNMYSLPHATYILECLQLTGNI